MGDHTPLPNKGLDTLNNQTDSVEDLLTSIENKLTGFNIPPYDRIVITYVPTGSDGAGEISTVVYSMSGIIVATLVLVYDSNNNLVDVTKT
jgi:hypothetical protein